MRSFVSRTLPTATLPRAAEVKTTAPWRQAFQRTADRRAGFASATDGRLALDDFQQSGPEEPAPSYGELVAVAQVPARADRITVATVVTIELLDVRLVVRAGLGSARLRLELSARSADDGDELGLTALELIELMAVGPDRAARPASDGVLRIPMACSWTTSSLAPARDLHVCLRARWDVDCGVDGQFLMRGRATASAPVIATTGGAATLGRLALVPRRRPLPF